MHKKCKPDCIKIHKDQKQINLAKKKIKRSKTYQFGKEKDQKINKNQHRTSKDQSATSKDQFATSKTKKQDQMGASKDKTKKKTEDQPQTSPNAKINRIDVFGVPARDKDQSA